MNNKRLIYSEIASLYNLNPIASIFKQIKHNIR